MSPMLDIQRRHADVYRLRLGEKGRNGAPQKLTDSIRITSPNQAVVAAFTCIYGGEVRPWEQQFEAYLPVTSLPVMVLPGQSLSQWWEVYKGTVCDRRCDGFTESLSDSPCKCPSDITVRMQTKGACRPMTRINIVCPEVAVVGAGSLVSHGMIAAETLPQAIAVAEKFLERGLMVPAYLRVVEHKGKKHYVVPQLEIVGVSLAQLDTGEAPALPEARPKALAPPPQRAIAPANTTPPELPGDPPPFTTDDEKLAGVEWVRSFAIACKTLDYGDELKHAIVSRATKGRTWTSKDVLKSDLVRIEAVWQALLDGKLIQSTDDAGRIVLLVAPRFDDDGADPNPMTGAEAIAEGM